MSSICRWSWVACVTICAWIGLSGESHAQTKLVSQEQEGLRWFDARQLGVEGQGWTENKSPYDRLPAKAEGKVRDAVWGLSRDSAGMCVRFVTDATTIHARWTLTKAKLEMPHMAATGVSGLDLYAKDDQGRWRWVAVGKPTAQTTTQKLAEGITPGKREYLIYLPLYNGVSSVEVGVPVANSIEAAAPHASDRAKPIVFYGTSITHGACASRPGMVHTAILGRKYGRPVINLGFSGNGRMEPEVTALIAELDAFVYVIDCCPNHGGTDEATRPTTAIGPPRHADRAGRRSRLHGCVADQIEAVSQRRQSRGAEAGLRRTVGRRYEASALHSRQRPPRRRQRWRRRQLAPQRPRFRPPSRSVRQGAGTVDEVRHQAHPNERRRLLGNGQWLIRL